MFNNEIKPEADIKEAIIRMVVFFDLFDYPLSALEIKENLNMDLPLEKIWALLPDITELSCRDGFYFLKGRDDILLTRRERHNYSLRKIKIARKFCRLFGLLPFIKVIALSNSIGQFNLRDGSDIDFFIITAPRRIWLTRLYCAGLAKVLNSRPSAENKRDKICLSFYLSSDNLNLDNLKLSAGDPYFFYWLRGLFLLYNRNRTYENFLLANNIDAKNLYESNNAVVKDNLLNADTGAIKTNAILDGLEKAAKKIQLIIMSPALKQAINNSVGVVVNDKVLKLYLRDNRQTIAEKYGIKLRQIFKEND